MEDPVAPRSDGVLFLVVGPLTRLSDRSAAGWSPVAASLRMTHPKR
jgi:hypothetical protein